MYAHHTGAGAPSTGPSSGLSPVAAVLLWVFVGWPLSWILLFLFAPVGLLFGIGITIWMIVVIASGRHAPSVVVNVATAAPLPIPPPVPSPAAMAQHTIRQEVESLAAINVVGGCGWCGSPSAHLNDSGYLVHPRHWHAAEIEERIRAKTLP
jgi:hypothetical protein